ncbi:MAG: cell division protein FtsA [bacterium]
MAGKFLNKNLVAIDIGTTKICVLIASLDYKGNIEILGVGQHPSEGLKKGVVVNIAKTVTSIKKAVVEAEKIAGIKIESAIIGISGGHIKSFNSTGVVAIRGQEITQDDIDRVIESAKAVAISQDQEVLHVLPQYFRVDGQEFVLDSLGMYGVRLEAQVHVITGAISSAQNIIRACELAGIRVQDLVLEQLASAEAVLSSSEKELGVGILDIGGGTSDFAVYKDSRIIHTKVLPFAGNHFTNDLAIGLGIPIKKAEELKRLYGFVNEENYLDLDKDKVEINLEYEGGKKKIETYSLYEILNPRAEEIYELLFDEILKFKLKSFMPSGIVLTGGGSLLAGMKEIALKKFKMQVRIGQPESFESKETTSNIPDLLKSPIYSTGYGLLLYSIRKKNVEFEYGSDVSLVKNVFKRMRSWVGDFF